MRYNTRMHMPAYSAPKSLIFLGLWEYAYGKPALGMALRSRLTCSAQEAGSAAGENTLLSALIHYAKKHNLTVRAVPFALRTHPQSPAQFAAAAAALGEAYTGAPLPLGGVASIAYAAQKQLYKKATGIEVSASVYGGLVYARQEFAFLKTFSSLPYKIPPSFLQGLALKKREGVQKNPLSALYRTNPDKAKALLTELETCTKRAVAAIVAENAQLFAGALTTYSELFGAIDATLPPHSWPVSVDGDSSYILLFGQGELSESVEIEYNGLEQVDEKTL